MSSQNPGKTKQKFLWSWVKPQDTKASVEDENVEESCTTEIPEGSSESSQDYAAVESVKAVGSQLPLLGDRPKHTGTSSEGGSRRRSRRRASKSDSRVRGYWPAAVQARSLAVPASRSSAGNGVRHLPIQHCWSAGLFSATRKCLQTPTEWDLHSC